MPRGVVAPARRRGAATTLLLFLAASLPTRASPKRWQHDAASFGESHHSRHHPEAGLPASLPKSGSAPLNGHFPPSPRRPVRAVRRDDASSAMAPDLHEPQRGYGVRPNARRRNRADDAAFFEHPSTFAQTSNSPGGGISLSPLHANIAGAPPPGPPPPIGGGGADGTAPGFPRPDGIAAVAGFAADAAGVVGEPQQHHDILMNRPMRRSRRPRVPVGDSAAAWPSIKYASFKWATLDATSPLSHDTGCQTVFLPVPKGWTLAEADADAIAVTASYPWGTDLLVLGANATQVYTGHPRVADKSGTTREWICCHEGGHALAESGRHYKVNACQRRILIKTPVLSAENAAAADAPAAATDTNDVAPQPKKKKKRDEGATKGAPPSKKSTPHAKSKAKVSSSSDPKVQTTQDRATDADAKVDPEPQPEDDGRRRRPALLASLAILGVVCAIACVCNWDRISNGALTGRRCRSKLKTDAMHSRSPLGTISPALADEDEDSTMRVVIGPGRRIKSNLGNDDVWDAGQYLND